MTYQAGESFLRAMADAVPGLIAHWDSGLRCTFANKRCLQWFGRPLAEIIGASMPSVLGEHLFGLAKPHVDAALAGEEVWLDRVYSRPDGTGVHAWVNYVPHRDESGVVCGFFVLVTDLTPLHNDELRTLESENHYRLLADHSSDMIFHLDRDFVRRYVSPASREILGYEPHELIGQRPVNQVHPDDADRVAAVFRSLVDGSAERSSVTNRIRHKDGQWVWVEVEFRVIKDPRSGQASGIIGAMRDISIRKCIEAQLAEAHLKLELLANEDGLTGLANRRSFDGQLSQAHRTAMDTGGQLSMVMIDVDWFKFFNDRYGHPAGDDCLRRVGETILASVRQPRDIAARYGGEEFAILLPKTDHAGALLVAERIRRSVARIALEHGDSPHGVVTISAGVACVESGTIEVECENLLRAADRALYAAKAKGRNMVCGVPSPDDRRERSDVSPGSDRVARVA